MKKLLRQASYLILVTLAFLLPVKASAQAPEISPDYTLVSKQRISRTVFEYTFNVTLINHDEAIQNVSATVTSSSPHTTIMGDGRVQFNDADANATIVGNNTVVFRQDRLYPFNREDLHWNITYEPVNQDVIIDLRFSPEEIEVIENKTEHILMGLHVISNIGDTPFNVKMTQKIEPAVNGLLSPNLNGETRTFSGSDFEKIDQTLPMLSAGEYQLMTSVYVPETGYRTSKLIPIKVKSQDIPQLHIASPSLGARAVAVDQITELSMHTSVAGKDMDSVTEVQIRSLDSQHNLSLSRTGVQIYKGILTFDTQGMQAGECLNFVAEATTSKGTVTSNKSELCVTSFPIESLRYPTIWVEKVSGGTRFALNEFWAIFQEGVSEEQIRTLVSEINGQVISVLFGKPVTYVIGLDPHPDTLPELVEMMNNFKQKPEVKQVEMSIGFPVSSLQTNDPVAGLQSWLSTIRADEAWFVAQGDASKTIVVADSGIDKNHPDLKNKIEMSKDFVGNELPSHYHGTHVAGIAGAEVNNGIGVAGVAWNNVLHDVKIADEIGIASPKRMVKAIEYSMDLEKPIINFSIGFQQSRFWHCELMEEYFGVECFSQEEIDAAKMKVCDAVKLAVEKDVFLVAAAGNAAKAKLGSSKIRVTKLGSQN